MWGERNPEEMVEAIQKSLENSNFPGEARVLSDPKHVDHMLRNMMHKLTVRKSSSSSDESDDGRSKKALKSEKRLATKNSRAGRGSHSSARTASKIRSYKDDKPEFDSYNVFNRCPPPDESPYPMPARKDAEIPPSNVSTEIDDSTGKNKVCNGQEITKVTTIKGPNRRKSLQNDKSSSKRPKRRKRPARTGRSEKNEVKKRPISRKTTQQMESRMRKYCETSMTTKERVEALSRELKEHQDEGRKKKESEELKSAGGGEKQAGDALFSDSSEFSDPLMSSVEGSTPEQQLNYLRTLAEMRSRKETTGHLWDSAVIFIDQGLAYNQTAKERRIWVNRWGNVTSDVNDPATDAVLLTGLSLGGLMMPDRSEQNPFDFTNSFLDAMMEKYPVLCKRGENKNEPDYAAVLQKFAQMFPLLITTYFVFAGFPKIKPLLALNYGLPPVVYYQGFPSLACQHLLEKDTNILPFLMIGLLHHLGDIFRDSNPTERLGLARIVWKHLKKMVDSTSLPWVCRESFCRRQGVCKDQAYHPGYLPRRLEAMQHLASSVPKSNKLYRLLVEIDDYDFRTNCPAANSLAISIADVHYMNVFYTVAVEELKEGYEPDDDKPGGEETNDSEADSDSLEAVERNLRKTEEELMSEAASLGERKFRKGGRKQFVVSLENEID